jgi:porin
VRRLARRTPRQLATLLLGCAALGVVHPAAAVPAFEVTYTAEAWRNTQGGLRAGGRYLDNLDLLLSSEVAQVDLRLHLLYNNAARLSEELIGDLQTVSNIDAPEAVRIYEAWVQRDFGGEDDASLRFGLYDLNAEFDSIETGALFINSSHGVGPDLSQSGANGPSIFPVTGLALRMQVPLSANVRARIAVLDAVPGDPESSGSHSLRLSSQEGALVTAELDAGSHEAARIFAGAWMYTRKAPTLGAEAITGDMPRARAAGGYAAVEGGLGANVRGFVRVGGAAEEVHVIERYTGAGITWQPPRLNGAALGIAVAHARTSAQYRELVASQGGRAESAETTFEATARVPLPGGFVLQPDVQYVLDPGADPALDAALAIGLRLEWSWSSP